MTERLSVLLFLIPGFMLPSTSSIIFGQTTAATVEQEIPGIEGIVVTTEDDKEQPTQKKGDDAEAQPEVSEMDHFMRVHRDRKQKPVAFETSVTRYILEDENGETVFVDLIGVVHIGEQGYYEELNTLFEKYDSVLYELVAPEGTVIPKGGGREGGSGLNPIAALQLGMQAVLGLEFQLEHINYEKKNFVHADMSGAEFLESMKNNDESFTKMFFRAMGQSMAQSGSSSMNNFDMLRVMFAKDKEIKMRQLFASQMINMEAGMVMFEGREGSTIINHRNGKAMQVLRREIDSGRKKLAIFYGAGHLPDMQRRLTSDFRMKRGGQFWLEAWKLKR